MLLSQNNLTVHQTIVLEYSLDIARLCEKYKGKGVVAIDIAGDESGAALDPRHVEAFDVS